MHKKGKKGRYKKMVKSIHDDSGNLLMNFQLPKIDDYLKAKRKYLEESTSILTFEIELKLIGDFTDMVAKYIKTFELLCALEQNESFDEILHGLNRLYHQFLRNLLLNERDFEQLMKHYFELKNLVSDIFGKKFIF